ncbi:MAG: DUF481 domain-containing protein [Xanthomonadales bacterium]|nr:DUF481 domain-containing protein [Xanthomonadales bacterium]
MNKRFKPGSVLHILLLLLIVSFCQAAWAEKTDIVYLKNGDRITGEIKTLIRGKLEFSTDHMGNVSIEWVDILKITSQTGQAIELTNGQRFYGALGKSEKEDMLMVSTPLGPADVNIEDVFAMYPVKASFWDRLDVTANLGLSWDKGSQVGKYSLGLDSVYRRSESITRASFSTEITTQNTVSDTQRTVLNGQHSIFKPSKKFKSYFANMESNDQLGIDLRALAGVGYGVMPVRSQRNMFTLSLGLDINREIPTAGEAETNLEGVGLLSYEYFKFSSPERTFKTDFTVFPSITDWGRWRATMNTNFRLEIVADLFWVLNVYGNYDTAPISTNGAKSDYGITSSLGYKF